MTSVAGSNLGQIEAPFNSSAASNAPSSWRELRGDEDIQFEQVEIPPTPPREPGWLDEIFRALADFFSPLGELLGDSWPILRWVLLALLIASVLFILWRMFGPLAGLRAKPSDDSDEIEWQPDREQSLALLEDADKLASDGRYDEAVHLLLQRSVGQIASARPDWVTPSSTARELA
ncbi:MAG: hypothetical protein AAGL68_06835, partial [Pseudomonadota bacterium]